MRCISEGIVTGEAVVSDGSFLPANVSPNSKTEIIQITNTGLKIDKIALDAGYDVGAIHRGFELLGITDYCCPRETHNNALKKGFTYHPETDSFECEKGKHMSFYRITYKLKNQSYYRLYRIPRTECTGCERLKHCAVDKGAVRINASGFYRTYYANRQRCDTKEYLRM